MATSTGARPQMSIPKPKRIKWVAWEPWTWNAGDQWDLRKRGPLSAATLQEINAVASADWTWTPEDEHAMAYVANRLWLEVLRLRLELHERERELASAEQVVSIVRCARDHLRDLNEALAAADAVDAARLANRTQTGAISG